MSDHDQPNPTDQDSTTSDDTTMGSPKGGGTTPADATGPGRYGGADEADDTTAPAADLAANSEHDPMGGPGATAGRDLGSEDALSTDGGSSAALSEGSGEVQ